MTYSTYSVTITGLTVSLSYTFTELCVGDVVDKVAALLSQREIDKDIELPGSRLTLDIVRRS